jgi:hypothetical protein
MERNTMTAGEADVQFVDYRAGKFQSVDFIEAYLPDGCVMGSRH